MSLLQLPLEASKVYINCKSLVLVKGFELEFLRYTRLHIRKTKGLPTVNQGHGAHKVTRSDYRH